MILIGQPTLYGGGQRISVLSAAFALRKTTLLSRNGRGCAQGR